MTDDEKKMRETLLIMRNVPWEAIKLIDAQADRIEALTAKCALLEASLAQEEKRSSTFQAAAIERGAKLGAAYDRIEELRQSAGGEKNS